MAAFDATPWLGQHTVAHSAVELDTINRYDKSHGSAHRDRTARTPASILPIFLAVVTAVSANNKDSVRYKAPFPLEILRCDVACETAAGTGLVDVKTDDGTTDQSILAAPIDVVAPVGEAVEAAPEDDKNQVDAGTEIYINVAGSAAVVGGQATLWVRRL